MLVVLWLLCAEPTLQVATPFHPKPSLSVSMHGPGVAAPVVVTGVAGGAGAGAGADVTGRGLSGVQVAIPFQPKPSLSLSMQGPAVITCAVCEFVDVVSTEVVVGVGCGEGLGTGSGADSEQDSVARPLEYIVATAKCVLPGAVPEFTRRILSPLVVSVADLSTRKLWSDQDSCALVKLLLLASQTRSRLSPCCAATSW